MNWSGVIDESRDDPLLAGLVEEVREYAQIYLLAKERQRGCNGMAQLVALKEEYADVVDNLLRYWMNKKDLPKENSEHDLDSIAAVFVKKGKSY